MFYLDTLKSDTLSDIIQRTQCTLHIGTIMHFDTIYEYLNQEHVVVFHVYHIDGNSKVKGSLAELLHALTNATNVREIMLDCIAESRLQYLLPCHLTKVTKLRITYLTYFYYVHLKVSNLHTLILSSTTAEQGMCSANYCIDVPSCQCSRVPQMMQALEAADHVKEIFIETEICQMYYHLLKKLYKKASLTYKQQHIVTRNDFIKQTRFVCSNKFFKQHKTLILSAPRLKNLVIKCHKQLNLSTAKYTMSHVLTTFTLDELLFIVLPAGSGRTYRHHENNHDKVMLLFFDYVHKVGQLYGYTVSKNTF